MRRDTITILILSTLLWTSMITPSLSATEATEEIPASGTVIYNPQTTTIVQVDANQVEAVNNLSLGFMLDWHRWQTFIERPSLQQLARNASFRLVRIFDFRKISPWGYTNLMPCTYWDEETKTGSWDWESVDELTEKIFEIDAEPLFCLGWARDNIDNYIPEGMDVNPATGLPYPESYAAYAREWVEHFEEEGVPVRYYQISNEPYFYFGWDSSDTTRLTHFVDFWNTVARAMRDANPNILLSHDGIMIKYVLDFWIDHGDDIDFLDFHKYDGERIGQYSDEELFALAERRHFETYGSYYGVEEASTKWYNNRGRRLAVICSECNLNYAWESGTDPKIQQMTGAVWLALTLRMSILKGLHYNLYFEYSSSRSQQESQGTGWGFGMVNEDDSQAWFPYLVNSMIGPNLAIGDICVNTDSSDNDLRSLGWIHDETLCVLLIHKGITEKRISVQGVAGEAHVTWIDSTIPHETPELLRDTIDSTESLMISGYTVALLQIPLS